MIERIASDPRPRDEIRLFAGLVTYRVVGVWGTVDLGKGGATCGGSSLNFVWVDREDEPPSGSTRARSVRREDVRAVVWRDLCRAACSWSEELRL